MNRSIAWIALVGLVIGAMAMSGCKGTKPHKKHVATEPAAAPGEPMKEPATEPAKEPASEPAKEPAPEPAKEPAPEPAKEPAPEPAKEPAAGDKVKTPWYDAKVGNMLKFKGMNDMTQTWEVTAVDDATATVKMTVSMPNVPGTAVEQKMPRWIAPTAAPAVPAEMKAQTKDLGTQEVTVSGVKLTCKVTETTITDKDGNKTVSKAWTCPDVLGGVVKTEAGGQVLMELVEIKN